MSAANSTSLSETNGTEGISTWRKDIKMKGKYMVDTEQLWHKLAEKIEHSSLQPNTNPIGSFGHIIGGYESQYYSYLWSKVYSCELFKKFKEQGLLDPAIGMKYRKIILAPGGSRDSLESLKLFLGREPNNKAFLL
jgi:Zn-dependent oligopeptidase